MFWNASGPAARRSTVFTNMGMEERAQGHGAERRSLNDVRSVGRQGFRDFWRVACIGIDLFVNDAQRHFVQ